MYLVSENYANKIIADDRSFAIRLTFNSSTVLTGTTIQSVTLDEVINSGDVLTIGCACSNKLTVNLINPPADFAYDGARFKADVGLLINDIPVTYEWVSLGYFFVTEAETKNDFKNLTLTAYDGFYKMTDKYNATVPAETTLQAVYDDLKTQLYENCGITLKARVLPAYAIANFPYLDLTYTQAVAYVAGCLGENARFDRNGELEMVWYTDSTIEISKSLQYMNGFTRTTEKPLTVTSIATGTSEVPIVRGDGANGIKITFENPFITPEMADNVFANVNNFTYTPCSIKWRGNPAVQVGDMVQAIDRSGIPHNVLVMSQSLKVGGGCNSTIECKGQGETTSEFSNKFEPVGQKIERIYSNIEKAILDATNKITGNSGGYVVLNDTNNDGKPDELLIMDVEDIPAATQVWRWNKEGLGYAYNAAGNAYNGSFRTAITADGQINADFITTGLLNADIIQIGDEMLGEYIRLKDGVMHFGSANNPMSLRLGNITVGDTTTQQVALYSGETRIAYFSSNSFEIENLQEGKIRFQNFGFITRESGNLSFTKLI
jgi:hypothetical protein